MNVNLYLPDPIGRRAKASHLPLSRLLRAAVEDALRAEDEAEAKAAPEIARHNAGWRRVVDGGAA